MKIKRIVTALTAMLVLCTGGTTIAMAEGDTKTAEVTSDASATPITAETVKGTWKGSFMGYDDNNMIERMTTLNIDKCDADGRFSGLAEITSVEDQSYFFEGTCNFETGEFNFDGIEWKINANNWSIFPFSGKIDPDNKTMSGIRNKDAQSPFSFEKTSDKYISYSIDPSKIAREWYGEYDGFHNNISVRRNILISIKEIADDGTIKGYAKFTPSDKADEKYALVGSYNFTGTLDKRFGRIKFQGDEWIAYPSKSADDNSEYQMIPFSGAISGNTIEGMTDYGIWKMESTDVLKGDLNFDNKLGVEDLVILNKYLLNDNMPFNKTLYYTADMIEDDTVDVFDLIELRKAVINYSAKNANNP